MSYRIDPALPVDREVHRIADEETAAIVAVLEAMPEGRQTAVHAARKRLKRLRGLLKLIGNGNKEFHDRFNVLFRDLQRALSHARDADALVETVDRFRSDGKAGPDDLQAIREHLTSRRDRIVHETSAFDEARAATLSDLRAAREAFAELELPDHPEEGAALLAHGARAMVQKAKKSLKHARKRGEADDFHELRKALKYHWMHLGLLGDMWPGASSARRNRANALGDLLGELNDIANMYDLLDAEEHVIRAPESVARFRKKLEKREKALRKAILTRADALLEGEGKKLRKKIGRAMAKAGKAR
ncbi:CHAD domain-containing protein [Nitratireductor luteus]|uniref:CHAD domain-containing protein n=1 Tax=Nitratireductor luteus TaxID=2976980 RepID=UPI00223F3A37|nr:CHAD domain-containing protein [Nitratireductor luteus]